MESRSIHREVKSLISINHGHLGMRRQNSVVAHLSGDLGSTDKRSARRGIAAVEVRESVSARSGNRRFRCKRFTEGGQAQILNPWSQTQRPKLSSAEKGTEGGFAH